MIIVDTRWAMVEIWFKYEGDDFHGYLWWNSAGDKYFMKLLGDKYQMYKVEESDGDGINTVVSKMSKMSNDDFKFEVQF